MGLEIKRWNAVSAVIIFAKWNVELDGARRPYQPSLSVFFVARINNCEKHFQGSGGNQPKKIASNYCFISFVS